MCEGLDYGIDFYVGLGQRRRGRSLTSPAGRATCCCRCCKPGTTPTGWTSFRRCSTRRGGRPPLSGYRRPFTAATWPNFRRSYDRIAQVRRSPNEVELDQADGTTRMIHRSEFRVQWTYKAEMELSLALPPRAVRGLRRLHRRPLTQETDEMVVLAWAAE